MSLKCTIIALIEQFATALIAASGKPSYVAGRGGANPDLTWLDDQGVPTNKTGIPFGLNNGLLKELWVGNELLTQYEMKVYWHDGDEVNLTLLKTVTIPNTARTKTFNAVDLGIVNVPKGVQIAFQVDNSVGGAPKNTKVHATITGSP